MTEETQRETLARGQKEGRIDALLEEHTKHLNKINGSIAEVAKTEQAMAEAIRKLDANMTRGLDKLERKLHDDIDVVVNDVRMMQEEQRSRDTKVESARLALAEDTERKRRALADTAAQGMTQRAKITLGLAVIALLLTALGIYLGIR